MATIIQQWKKLNPPVRWFIYFLGGMLALSFLFAPTPRPVDYAELNFSTQSSSRLYFKNVRSYYYHIFNREKAPFVIYRLKRRVQDSIRARLQFIIVENSLADEAYIFAEANTAAMALGDASLRLPDTILRWQEMNNEGHLRLAAGVYNALLKDEQIWLLSFRDSIQPFPDERARDNAITVLEDYFKLTNKQ